MRLLKVFGDAIYFGRDLRIFFCARSSEYLRLLCENIPLHARVMNEKKRAKLFHAHRVHLYLILVKKKKKIEIKGRKNMNKKKQYIFYT